MLITSKFIVFIGIAFNVSVLIQIENMLIAKRLFKKIVKNVRFSSVASVSPGKETLLIQKTTYPTDDWTNINSRFEPFVGAKLYQKRNHPLRLTQEELVTFFRKWFGENVNSNSELAVCNNLDPIEPNTSPDKDPTAFYVNRNLVLRTHAINREIKYLQSGFENFLMIVDLYRRCEMDAKHFPTFHRVNVFRTMDCATEAAQNLEKEQKAALVALVKHLMGTDVKYRWTDVKMASTEPSWMFEIWHAEEWHRISGSGLIRRDILEQSDRPNTAGWEISIGLDRLAMILYNIFDIRLLWNADQSFLKQFEPKISKISKTPAQINAVKSTNETDSEAIATKRPLLQTQPTFVPKARKCEMNISYTLPRETELESFPVDALCKFIKDSTENAAERVNLNDFL